VSTPVVTEIQTRFADLDPLGHVNNVTFFTYMETARVAFMRDQGGGLRGNVLVVHSECHHRHEIAADVRTVRVEVSVEKVGRSSLLLLHEMWAGKTHVATGRVTLVAVDGDRRPRPIDDDERAALIGQSGSG
jgi:acyl-CoA thioester hydrolase